MCSPKDIGIGNRTKNLGILRSENLGLAMDREMDLGVVR
jgi:hypothetical protein